MSILSRLREILAETKEHRDALSQRIATNTERVEQLLAQNAADATALVGLENDVAYLETQIAQLGEHEPLPVLPGPTPSDSRREAEEIVRARHEADTAARQTRTGRHQRSKPDAVKAARRAARAAAQEQPAKRAPRTSTDPLTVRRHTPTPGKTVNRAPGVKRLEELTRADIDMAQFSKTDTVRADLFHEMMLENQGCMDTVAMARAWADLMDCPEGTAKSHVSRLLRVLKGQGRVVFVDRVDHPDGGRNSVARWKALRPTEVRALPVQENAYTGSR